LSLHTGSCLEADLDDLIENSTESEYSKHKEEGKTRIANDTQERQCLRAKLEICVDPLNLDTHHGELVNIVTGQHGIEKVNVQNAVSIRVQHMNDFRQKLPHGLYDSIHKKV
jgi:ABC-type histidine transport system ATPase subunit